MPSVVANGIQIEHETFGEPSSSPLLLIIGLAGQLIFWDEELCKQLADRGHYVIRFDNRDVGFSSKLEESGVPDVMKAIEALMRGEEIKPPYMIEDMVYSRERVVCERRGLIKDAFYCTRLYSPERIENLLRTAGFGPVGIRKEFFSRGKKMDYGLMTNRMTVIAEREGRP